MNGCTVPFDYTKICSIPYLFDTGTAAIACCFRTWKIAILRSKEKFHFVDNWKYSQHLRTATWDSAPCFYMHVSFVIQVLRKSHIHI